MKAEAATVPGLLPRLVIEDRSSVGWCGFHHVHSDRSAAWKAHAHVLIIDYPDLNIYLLRIFAFLIYSYFPGCLKHSLPANPTTSLFADLLHATAFAVRAAAYQQAGGRRLLLRSVMCIHFAHFVMFLQRHIVAPGSLH